MIDKEDIARRLGVAFWTTELFIPRYRPGQVGIWRIDPGGNLYHDWGYYTGACLLEKQPSLSRRKNLGDGAGGDSRETWMALTPHEIESQELGCRHAHGHAVVMGLGMGWIAANVALKPEVEKTTVVECDPDVIELFTQSGALESLPESARRKLRFIHGDALDWRPPTSDSVDFLYADIWPRLADPSTLLQVRQMQANVQAEQIYYWGQELDIYGAAKPLVGESSAITAAAVQHAVAHVIELPLLIPEDIDYPQMIEKVIQNRIERRRATGFDLSEGR